MGRAAKLKKERSKANKGLIGQSISDEVMDKLEREIRRDTGQGKNNKGMLYEIPTYREWPCQMLDGNKVLLPAHITPYNKDGKLYFKIDNEEFLVVSNAWREREKARIIKEAAQKEVTDKKKVTELTPTKLGE